MATRLKSTEVVVVGLGAAGGIAAYVLARAGIDMVGIEAGPRLTLRDFAPNKVRSNRNWMGRSKANLEVPTRRLTEQQTATRRWAPHTR